MSAPRLRVAPGLWLALAVAFVIATRGTAYAHGPCEDVDDCHDIVCSEACCPIIGCVDAICRTFRDPSPECADVPECGPTRTCSDCQRPGGCDGDFFTQFACVDGACQQVPLDGEDECAVASECVVDAACDRIGGCDGDTCTRDICLDGTCAVSADPDCVPDECAVAGDCEAGTCREVDCVLGVCVVDDCEIECSALEACEDCATEGGCDENPCTAPACDDGRCELVTIPDCDASACADDSDCQIDRFCPAVGGCDEDRCTVDRCEDGICRVRRLESCRDDRCVIDTDCPECAGPGGCDGDPCTANICGEAGHCEASRVADCVEPACRVDNECETDGACAQTGGCDGDICTVDACASGRCTVVVDPACAILCAVTADCVDCDGEGGCDRNVCTELACIDARCRAVRVPDCGETDPECRIDAQCTTDSRCDRAGGCDQDTCTVDACVAAMCAVVEVPGCVATPVVEPDTDAGDVASRPPPADGGCQVTAGPSGPAPWPLIVGLLLALARPRAGRGGSHAAKS